MYLKRLEMKGFKSFADKVSVSLEPGISAIVGPNGSGKSNICDAILWVLGERNAKSLRGAVMEDVIFAGSTKRSAVSVAEVSLILDNSDGLLPIEYNEVSVSRRLYRSGESEYLINGVNSRRLDVLDILHDSGIGTDTNSIISQGHLDSILQSKPMDRRTLIEEAAGVLKHKQRKLRSQHKLERMDQNLERIGDVMAEIERQLKPLRIKAKRAEAYDGLVEEASQLTLEIAVDDLKKIKAKWDKVEQEKNNLAKNVEEKKALYQKKDEELTSLRNKIASQNTDIVEYTNKQRKLNSCIDKLSTFAMLMAQKAQNAQEKFNTLLQSDSTSEAISPEKKQILDDIAQIESKHKSMQNELSELKGQCEKAKNESEAAEFDLNEFDREYKAKEESLRSFSQEQQDFDLKIQIADTAANEKKLFAVLKDISEKTENNHKEIDEKTKIEAEELASLEELTNQLNDVNANILAIEKMLEASYEEASDATKWLNNNKNRFKGIKNLSDAINVPEKYLNLVEALLGAYSSSYITSSTDVKNINNEIKSAKNAHGSLRLVSEEKNNYHKEMLQSAAAAAKKYNAVCLSDEVKINDDQILSVLSNVVVFETSDKAFLAADDCQGLCLASLDGTVIYPDGRYMIGGPFYIDGAFDNDSTRTILSYKKNLEKLNKNASVLNKKAEEIQIKADKIDVEIKKLREKEMQFQNEIATAKAEHDFAIKRLGELKNNLKTDIKDEDLKVENIKAQLEKLKASADDAQSWISSSQDKLDNLKNISLQKKETYNNFVIRHAALEERVNAHNELLQSAKQRLANQENQEKQNAAEIHYCSQISRLCLELNALFVGLANKAKANLESLDKQFSSVNQEAAEIQRQSEAAIKSSNEARAQFDAENQKLSEVQVELGKLEVRVQNAVDTIDGIEGVSVDKALEMPDIQDREEKEERLFKLRRRIANMGVINPDAKQEYETLKERYDFLNGQISDLTAAKVSLSKIDKIIDGRLRDDFITTFDEVNSNFQEIFAILFPGGKARLELELPNDIENSGVEVKAQPHGKSVSKMSLLSGGEKSLVALCLLFAVYKKRSTPFYILDEVEAALDDTNLRRLIKYLENLRDTTQLIMITHQRRTMEMADVLYGVSMKDDGVTKVVSQRLDKDNRLHDIDKQE